MLFENIPAELRALIQWVCWNDNKIPHNPRTGVRADVTNRQTWGSHDEAVTAVQAGRFRGIGFVFTKDDPYCGIDLDDTKGDAAAFERQRQLEQWLGSYSERSPSGRGLHIIVKANVPSGKRRDRIEIYSSERYFTMTGDVVRNAPIADKQAEVEDLWSQMDGGRAGDAASTPYGQAVESDDAVIAMAMQSEKFRALWNGDGSVLDSADKSGSVIDQTLVNMLQSITNDPAQIERIWLRSPHGQRPKTQNRKPYRDTTIKKAFDGGNPNKWEDLSSCNGEQWFSHDGHRFRLNSDGLQYQNANGDLPTITADQLLARHIPPRDWLVKDIVPHPVVASISADGGTGKSLLMLQLGCAVVSGTDWLGIEVKSGKCLYFNAEDDPDEISRRLVAICGNDREHLSNLIIAPMFGRDALLATFDKTNKLTATTVFGELRARIAELRPTLVVLDTLADIFGGEENSRLHARQFVSLLRNLTNEFGVTVMIVSHPSLTGIQTSSGLSGSTAWNNSVRARLYMTRMAKDEQNSDYRTLTINKANYGPAGEEIWLRYDRGKFVRQVNVADNAVMNLADKKFMELLRDQAAKGRTLSASKNSHHDYVPKVFDAHPQSDGIKKKAFEQAMHRLLAAGRIAIVDEPGRPMSKPKKVLVEKSASNSPS